MRIVYSILFVGCTVVAHAQYTLDTLRRIHPRPGTGLSAIWGYTAPDGREYALVGITGSGSGSTSGGTSIVDITDARNPRVVTHINGPNSTWREMKTYRHYAYVVTEAPTATGVQIIDLSLLPDTARLLTTFNYTSGTRHTRQSHTISIHDGYMYLNGCQGWPPGGILIFDLRTNPLSPQFVGQYQPQYIHDSYVLRDTIFAAAIYSGGGLYIANATNKANVQTIVQIRYAGSGTHSARVTKDRRYALTTDEIGTTRRDLKIWDISNLPTVDTIPTATFTVNPNSTIHNVHVRGDFAYCSWYNDYALQIVDITNPASPVLAAGYSIPGSGLSWEVYPYFPSGKIILGAGSTGLWIFRFSGLAPRVPVTLLEPLHNDTLETGSPITFRWTKSADLNRDPHYYEVRLTGPGLDTIWRASDSVSRFTNLARLQQGSSYTWRIYTRDEWNETPSPSTSTFWYMGPLSVNGPSVPTAYRLEQNFPNPFNPSTTIRYEIPQPGYVSLSIHNVLGQEVASLVQGEQKAGWYDVSFNASNLPSGIYIYRLHAGKFVEAKKMLLLR